MGDHLETVRIKLEADNTATVLANGKPTDRKGIWTMIYDQALSVILDEGGPYERITANFKFTIKDYVMQD